MNMQTKHYTCSAIILIMILITPSKYQAVGATDTFMKLIEVSTKNNHELMAKKHIAEAAKSKKSSSIRSYFPQIDLQASNEEINYDVEDDETFLEWGIHFKQKLIDFEAIADISLSKSEFAYDKFQRDIKKSEVILKTAISYFDWLEKKELLQIGNENLELLLSHLRKTQRRFKAGDLTKTDVWQSNERFALAEVKQENASIALKKKSYIFRGVTGIAPNVVKKLPNITGYIKRLKSKDISRRINSSPTIGSLIKQVDIQKQKVKQSKSIHYPTVYLAGSQTDTRYSKGGDDEVESTLMIKVDLPIFSSGKDYSANVEAIYKKKSTEQMLMHKKREMEYKLRSSLKEINRKEKVISKYNTVLTFAEKALMGVRKEFKSGTKTNTDVLNAQREMIAAKEKKILELYNLNRLKYIFLYNLGLLNKQKLESLL